MAPRLMTSHRLRSRLFDMAVLSVPRTPDDNPYWISPAEAADFLGVSVRTLARWNVHKYVTPGGHRRYLRSDIEALANGTPARVIRRNPAPRAALASAHARMPYYRPTRAAGTPL
jgi:hypothetical protein